MMDDQTVKKTFATGPKYIIEEGMSPQLQIGKGFVYTRYFFSELFILVLSNV